jgi:hypothetical protein
MTKSKYIFVNNTISEKQLNNEIEEIEREIKEYESRNN